MSSDSKLYDSKKYIFIIGAKNIGQYGGYETFVEKLLEQHKNNLKIQYFIVTKANGSGYMNEKKLSNIETITNVEKNISSFKYLNAIVCKIRVPRIGAAQAIVFDVKAFKLCLRYIKKHQINSAYIYVLACRLGVFFRGLVEKAHNLGVKVYVNPDGHEWKRKKWSRPVRLYWKSSEKHMVKYADMVVCDSRNIEKYIKKEYSPFLPKTKYIAYGADINKSTLMDNDSVFVEWLNKYGLKPNEYYMFCGRFVPENSIDIMIQEFMKSSTRRKFAIISTRNDKELLKIDARLHWKDDNRIIFVGSVYDKELLKKIRENAYGNIHGHTVGGTNPSLLEALTSTELNLVLDVPFNREVAKDAALYWSKDEESLKKLIDFVDNMNSNQRLELGKLAKKRIIDDYSWEFIGNEYKRMWLNS